MKRAAAILLFLASAFWLLASARAADLVVSNNAIINIFGDSYMDSDASAGVVTGYRFPDYLESYFQLNYPNGHIHFFNISRSGGTMEDVLTNREQQAGFALWGYTNNNFQLLGISQPTDNGSLTSNQMYLAQSNVFQAPGLASDGDDTLHTHTGWAATHIIGWVGLGDVPGEAMDGGVGTLGARNDASTNAGWVLGIRGVDSFHSLSNSWTPDLESNSGANVQAVHIPAYHFLSGGALSWLFSFLRGITTDTNISTCSLDWGATINGTNHCYISGLSIVGNTMTFTRHDDRLPMAYDKADGTITNDAGGAFVLNPSDANFFQFTLKITGLPPGNYRIIIDGVVVAAQISSAELSSANGWNMFTNTVGPYWAQRTEVLGRIRDKEHIDRVTLSPLGQDGTGMLGYFSAVGTPWSAGLRGDALITSTLTNNVANLFALDALTASAAQPTSHTFTVTLITSRYVAAHQ